MKSPANVPSTEARDIKETLLTPGKNFGKDNYTIDLTGAEATYWLGTEAGFWNLNSLKWLTQELLTPIKMRGRYTLQPSRAGDSQGMLGGTSG